MVWWECPSAIRQRNWRTGSNPASKSVCTPSTCSTRRCSTDFETHCALRKALLQIHGLGLDRTLVPATQLPCGPESLASPEGWCLVNRSCGRLLCREPGHLERVVSA